MMMMFGFHFQCYFLPPLFMFFFTFPFLIILFSYFVLTIQNTLCVTARELFLPLHPAIKTKPFNLFLLQKNVYLIPSLPSASSFGYLFHFFSLFIVVFHFSFIYVLPEHGNIFPPFGCYFLLFFLNHLFLLLFFHFSF